MKQLLNPSKKYSLARRIFITCMLIILIPAFLIGGYGYYTYMNNIEKLTIRYSEQILFPLKQQIENTFEQYESSIVPVWLDQGLQELIRIPGEDWGQYPRKMIDVKRNINDIFGWQQHIRGVLVLTKLDGILSSGTSYSMDPDYHFANEPFIERSQKMNQPFIYGPAYQTYGGDQFVFSIVRPLWIMPSYQWEGVIKVDIHSDEIFKRFQSVEIGDSGEVMAFDSQHKIVYHPDQQLIGDHAEFDFIEQIDINKSKGEFYVNRDGVETLVVYENSEYLNWTFIGIVPKQEINEGAISLMKVVFMISIITLMILLVIYWNVSYATLKPIHNINHAIKKLGSGDFTSTLQDAKIIELEPIVNQYNRTVERLNQLTFTLYLSINKQHQLEIQTREHQLLQQEALLRQREAELGQLEAQINPHFLNNTLSSIQSLAELEELEKIDRAVYLLSQLLSYSVKSTTSKISLSEELEHIDIFIDIQKIRHEDTFRVNWDIDEALYDWKINRLMLQPIVENAFLHGIEPKEEPGLIHISIKKYDTDVEIIVEDNGIGMSQQQLKNLRGFVAYIKHNPVMFGQDSKQVRLSGIKNIIKRFMLIYGSRCQITIDSKEDQGTKITIHIQDEVEHDD
ncbi:cache domain-containing sensor histidine kinase [Gracilibacillus alcaliphilus]|uniref:cache domain-containing sensor histidine kinase n=1 Tax=Gracilibacillus alcaliphilus TaxID=1401441 RepID=UPI00195D2986|nr:sensor histidine kinase [Gracilibacillus alcaliphilus]MBM7676771.1 two-component system sensor histidine kinase YesM [Gracilibacillus alcaliphilus]